jgi:hypothetical protein
MSRLCFVLSLLGLLLIEVPTCLGQNPQQQQPEQIPAPAPISPPTFLPATMVAPPGVMSADGPITMQLDPRTSFPPSGPPISLFSPFEFYSRTGAALTTGRGGFADVLRTGVGVDTGVRSFLINDSHTGAWYGDLGLGYLYNDSRDNGQGFIRTEPAQVTRLGQVVPLVSETTLGLRELHRTNVRLAFGGERYFQSNRWENVKYSIGGDVGGVWGNTTAKTTLINRNIMGEQQGDVPIDNPRDLHSSDVNKGFFFGCNFNAIFPHKDYDFIMGTRIEWERDYYRIIDNDPGSSELKLYLEFGWRF